jgi:hypothetical protein
MERDALPSGNSPPARYSVFFPDATNPCLLNMQNTLDIQSVYKYRKCVVISYYSCEKLVKNLTWLPNNLQVTKSWNVVYIINPSYMFELTAAHFLFQSSRIPIPLQHKLIRHLNFLIKNVFFISLFKDYHLAWNMLLLYHHHIIPTTTTTTFNIILNTYAFHSLINKTVFLLSLECKCYNNVQQ